MRNPYRWLPAGLSTCLVAMGLGFPATPAAAQVTVTSSTPNNASQGTTNLNVSVAGTGFAKGAKASWYVSGTTDTGGVAVNSTTFISSSQVVANITIPATATVSGYDIQVNNTSGRTGVGRDLFTVNPEAVSSFLYSTDRSGSSFTVQGDGLSVISGASVYDNTPSNCSTAPTSTCTIMSLLPNDWYLRLGNQIYRTIKLTFLPVGSSPDESVLDGSYPAAIATRCFGPSNNWVSIPLTIMPNNSNNHCSLRFNFSAKGTNYFYVMSPIYAGTWWASVACTSGTPTSTCNAWTITPTPGNLLPNASLANVANLYTVGKSGKLTLIGTYIMSFNIALTQ